MAGTFLFSAAICVLMPHGNIDHFAHVGGVVGGFLCYLIMTPNHRIPLELPQDPNPSPHIVRHGSIDSKHFRRSHFTNAPPTFLEPTQVINMLVGTGLLIFILHVVEQADWIADINIIAYFLETVKGDDSGVFGSALVGMAAMASTPKTYRKSRYFFEPHRMYICMYVQYTSCMCYVRMYVCICAWFCMQVYMYTRC